MSRFFQCGIDQSHCAQVTQELCMHMVTMTHSTSPQPPHVDVLLHPRCSDAMHIIHWLVALNGFPPKLGI